MADVHVIGLDIAKSVFQLHGLDGAGATVLQKRLSRARLLPFFQKLPPCLVGIEACATSHYWSREIARLGHEVRLMPAQYVKPYVKRQKNDMADAEAIAEAVTRPNMRFVAGKDPHEQSAMMLHKVRLMLNRQLVMLTNAIRAHMAEIGIVAPVGCLGVDRLLAVIEDETDHRIPEAARQCLQMLVAQLKVVKQQILENDRRVLALARSSELGRRLMAVPGIGPLVASALVACVPDPSVFSMRTQHGSLDGTGASAKLVWRQGALGIDHQGRQSLPAPNAVCWRHGRNPTSHAEHATYMARQLA